MVKGNLQKHEHLTSGYTTTENASLHQQPLIAYRSSGWVEPQMALPAPRLDVERLHLVQVILAAVS